MRAPSAPALLVEASLPERGLDVRLQVPAGSTLALVGPNGAGKSSLLQIIGGGLRPREGRVVLGGQLLTAAGRGAPRLHVPMHERQVTTLSQDPALLPHLTVRGNIAFGARAAGLRRTERSVRVDQLVVEHDLGTLEHRRPGRLSGGQAQRAAIARALAADPRLLLLDEPMAALDVEVAAAVREHLRTHLRGRTAVMVTHDLVDAMMLADAVAVIEDGRITDHASVAEVLSAPRTDFAARLAGLQLLRGRAEAGALVTDGGLRLPLPSAVAPPGARLLVALRPSRVRLLPEGATAPAPAPGAVRLGARVLSLAPQAELVRIHTEAVDCDVPPAVLASRTLHPGEEIVLEVPGDALHVHPQRTMGA